jgi:ABC-type phosphate transport system substrate-binding protein
VSKDPNAIGYGDLKKVRFVKIAAIRTSAGAYLPTPDHVQAGRYPLSRRLMFFLRPDAPRQLLDFVRWAPTRSDIVREMNFAPVK